jgi:hypothetical protein
MRRSGIYFACCEDLFLTGRLLEFIAVEGRWWAG